jgi:4-amino-4-deoxy-L-arabinose transferase-like glycosyltransferase
VTRLRGSAREWARRVPAPLALLLGVIVVFGVAWVLIVPAWQAPDEDAHFAYVQSLTEQGRLPGNGTDILSSEQRNSELDTNTDPVVFARDAKPEWGEVAYRYWRNETQGFPRNNGGSSKNKAAQYPPGYYLYESLPYELASSADVLTRLYLMRLFSIAWLLVTAVGAWLLAGELFGRRRHLQLVAAAVTGLWPMLMFVSSSINPDAMLIALWTLATWLGVAILKRGFTPARAAGLCACVGVALVTKATALALLPATTFALAVGAWRLRGRVTRRQALVAASTLAALALPVLVWVLVAHSDGRSPYQQTELVSATASAPALGGGAAQAFSVREFASYLWQFYLPRLPFQTVNHFIFPVIGDYPAYQVWIGSGWATFGWVNVWFDSWVYLIFLAVTVLALTGALVTAIRGLRRSTQRWRGPRTPWLVGAFLALDVGVLLAGLHWTDYRMFVDGEAPFLQGRYLFPVAGIAAAVAAQALRAVPARLQGVGAGAVIAGLVVFQIACLGLVASRYYA